MTRRSDLESLSLRDLQQRYREVVGEETRCPNRTFLIRKVYEALETARHAVAQEPTNQSAPPEEATTAGLPAAGVSGGVTSLLASESAIEAVFDPEQASAPDVEGSQETADESVEVDEPSRETEHAEAQADPNCLGIERPIEPDEERSRSSDAACATSEPEEADAAEGAQAEAPSAYGHEAESEQANVSSSGTSSTSTPGLESSASPEIRDGEPACASPDLDNVVTLPSRESSTAQPQTTSSPTPQVVPIRQAMREARDRVSRRRPRQSTGEPRPPRGRFRDMTIEQMQALYLRTVGRPTQSTDKPYLIWKVREAERGRIPIGPRESRRPDQESESDMRILPLRLEGSAVDAMDSAWKTRGMRSRMEFFRKALAHYLKEIGEQDAARHFESNVV